MKTIDTILQIRLGDEFFGIDSDISNQILRVPVITSIPLTHKSLNGIVVLNGKIVPVLDLKTVLGTGEVDVSQESSRIITLNIEDDEIAILVDEVVDALNMDESKYEENISKDSTSIGFYKHNEELIQIIEPKNIIKKDMIESFSPISVDKLSNDDTHSENSDTDTNRYLFFKAKEMMGNYGELDLSFNPIVAINKIVQNHMLYQQI